FNLQHRQRQAHPEPQHQQQLMSVTLMLTSLTSPADCTLEEFLRSDCGLILKRGTEASTIGQAKNSDEVDENTPLAVKGFTPGVGHLDSRRVRIDDCLVGSTEFRCGLATRSIRLISTCAGRLRSASPGIRSACLVTLSFNRRQQQSAQDLPASQMPPPPPVYDLESNCAILVGSGGGGGGGG
uniref:PDZ domain-containing protein n=1 Tax=Macrostomum lignano TaxID=282301 RepID=A0A1I8IZL5_9PLAT